MDRHDYLDLLGGDPGWVANYSLGGCEFYGEIMDSATAGVWLSNEPIDPDDYAALEPPDGFGKSGVGRSMHDAAFFRGPPNADTDGPLERMQVNGRWFSLVARPGSPEPGFDGVIVLPVYKNHRVLFSAGRTLEVIDTADGMTLVHQARETHLHKRRNETVPRRMPDGWTSRTVELTNTVVIDLPCPARVAIFNNGDIFHGPVTGRL